MTGRQVVRPDGHRVAAPEAMLDALRTPAGWPDRRSSDVEARWRQVLEAAREAYVAIDAEGVVVDWNRRAREMFGWNADEAVGRPAAALLADGVPALERILTVAVEDLGEAFDLAGVDRSGRRFPAECTVWGVDRRGGTVFHVFLHDMTDRRRAEQSAALLTAVVEGSADAIVARDLSGKILTWNRGAERMFGSSAMDAIGRPDGLLVPADRRGEFDDMVDRLVHGERVPAIETEQLTRRGTRIPVALTLSPVRDAAGRLVATSTIFRDVTEQRWMAETLDATLQALQTAADEARESAAVTRRFLADAAHQLRTPVAGIQACAETLRLGVSRDDADRLLAMLVRETSRAGALISSLLRIAHLDQRQPSRVEPVDLHVVCAEEVARVSLLRPALDVVIDPGPRPAGPALADRAACTEILGNLVDNAVRHARHQVQIQIAHCADHVSVRVRDDGPGVPGDSHELVFERFVTLDGRGGSGLGLAIARALARAMGGDLRCDGDFVLTLPSHVGRSGTPPSHDGG